MTAMLRWVSLMTSQEIILEREPNAASSLTKWARMVAADPLLSVVMPVFNERQTILRQARNQGNGASPCW